MKYFLISDIFTLADSGDSKIMPLSTIIPKKMLTLPSLACIMDRSMGLQSQSKFRNRNRRTKRINKSKRARAKEGRANLFISKREEEVSHRRQEGRKEEIEIMIEAREVEIKKGKRRDRNSKSEKKDAKERSTNLRKNDKCLQKANKVVILLHLNQALLLVMPLLADCP